MARYMFLLWLLWNNNIPGIIQATVLAQVQPDLISGEAGLNTCIQYALEHQPLTAQLKIRDQIARKNVAAALSDWLPQVELNANYQHYLLQPVSIFPDFTNPEGPKREVTTGVVNTSSVQIGANQVIYSPEAIIAGTSAKYYRRQSVQSNKEQLINLILNISKAFYNVLLTEARLDIFLEDRARIDRSLKDAFSLYETGLNDKIDYQRARIALNNKEAEIGGTREEIKASYAYLKELIGYPVSYPLSIAGDSNIAEKARLDTSVSVNPRDRIEYQLLVTNMQIQHAAVNYQRLQFLPTVTAFANYNIVYQNDEFRALYDRDFPNSSAGLRVIMPIFEGGRRIHMLKIARLRLNDLQLDTLNLKSRINTEFETAIASYKMNLKALGAARENVKLADGIYNTIRLQYNQGIKSFLEVIVSEADLRSARINELNALYRLITSKLEVDAALGKIQVNY